jgi:hypothetical protein
VIPVPRPSIYDVEVAAFVFKSFGDVVIEYRKAFSFDDLPCCDRWMIVKRGGLHPYEIPVWGDQVSIGQIDMACRAMKKTVADFRAGVPLAKNAIAELRVIEEAKVAAAYGTPRGKGTTAGPADPQQPSA